MTQHLTQFALECNLEHIFLVGTLDKVMMNELCARLFIIIFMMYTCESEYIPTVINFVPDLLHVSLLVVGYDSLVPRPHVPSHNERGVVTIERFFGSAESAKCY